MAHGFFVVGGRGPCLLVRNVWNIRGGPWGAGRGGKSSSKKNPHQEPRRSPERMILIHQPLPESPDHPSKFPFPPVEEEDCIIIPDKVPNLLVEVPNLLVEEQGRN